MLVDGANLTAMAGHLMMGFGLISFLVAAFLIWFIWAFLNDSQGRLYRWTENSGSLAPIHKIAKVPAKVQEALDAAAATRKNLPATSTDKTKPAAAAAAQPAVSPPTNTVPAN